MKGMQSIKSRLWGNLKEKPSFFSKYCCCSFAKSCLTLCDPMDSFHLSLWDFPGKNIGVVAISFSRDLPRPGIKPASPALTGRFFITKLPRKPSKYIPRKRRVKGGTQVKRDLREILTEEVNGPFRSGFQQTVKES